MNEDIIMDDLDVCVIFKKDYLQRSQRIIYKPYKIVRGNIDYDEYMFIDEEGNSYHHIYERMPGNSFAFRISLLDLEKEYDTNDFDVISKEYFNAVNDYYYHFTIHYGANNEETFKIIMENKETHKVTDFKDDDYLEFIDPLNINDKCDDEYSFIEQISDDKKKTDDISSDNKIVFDPHMLVNEIKKNIINQDEAIKTIITTIWVNSVSDDIHNNILLIGNTGVGKTEILRNICKLLDIPFYSTSMASYSKTGYVGASITDILDNLVKMCDGDINKAERGIIFLDEIDKIAVNSDRGATIGDTDIQNELLKIMEDGIYPLNSSNPYSSSKEMIHTKNITFIGAGTFDGIICKKENYMGFGERSKSKVNNYKKVTNEDLIKYGFKPEFMGRMPIIVLLNDLSKEDLINIMKYSSNNTLSNYINMFNNLGIKVVIDDKVYERLADKALELKIGARGLNSEINKLFLNIVYEISNTNNKYNYLEITEDILDNPNNYKLKYVSKVKRVLRKNK